MSNAPARYEPEPSEVAAPFWDATRGHRLILQWCVACEQPVFFPRAICPRCLGSDLEWRPASGLGTVYAVTIEHRPQNPAMAAMAPYAVALVDLDEGVRMLSNVIGVPPESITVGQRVTVAWEPLSDGRNLVQFTPVAA